jgi:hypothetical protein
MPLVFEDLPRPSDAIPLPVQQVCPVCGLLANPKPFGGGFIALVALRRLEGLITSPVVLKVGPQRATSIAARNRRSESW